MPLPQGDAVIDNTSATDTESPKLQFSYVECLMFAFHQVARRCPQFLIAEDNADRLKDFRMRSFVFHFPVVFLSQDSVVCSLLLCWVC